MAMTPEEWLPILAGRLDERFKESTDPDAYPGIRRLRRYAHGKPDLPEMGENLRESWARFQKKALRNPGGIAVTSLVNRCVYSGVRIGSDESAPALVAARRIARDNRLESQITRAIRDMIETRWGYLVVGRDEARRAVVTRERPEQFVHDSDPVRPWKARAALKVWRDPVTKTDHAVVWTPGVKQWFTRPSLDGAGVEWGNVSAGRWDPGAVEEYDGDPPVVVFEQDQAFLEEHLGLIDAIVLGKLQRLVITAMQAFRQRALKHADGSGDIDKDESGNDVNLAKVLAPAPGALWDLPEGIDIWESQTADLSGLIEGEKQDARDFAAETGTPIAMLLPDGQNQSAEGAATGKEMQVARALAITRDLSPAVEVLFVYALRAEGIDLRGETVEALWRPAQIVSLAEQFDAATKAKAAGLSARTIKRDILGMTPEQIRQDEADLAADQLTAALLTVGGGGGADSGTA